MKKRWIWINICFIVGMAVVTGFLQVYFQKQYDRNSVRNNIVLTYEIEKLTEDDNGQNPAKPQIEELKKNLKEETLQKRGALISKLLFLYFIISILYLFVIFGYYYRKLIRPFQTLESYAEQVASGNLDIKLPYERTNFFGAFTWAFDHMREEMQFSRKSEAAAIEENKTIIATLSHDIKTPIASIRAYAEGLEAGLDASFEIRERYVSTIMKKCDEVTRLTNDLVLHSLSQLDKLEVRMFTQNIGSIVVETIHDLEYEQIVFHQPVPDAWLCFDGKRLAQVLENLLNNAKKYALGQRVDVFVTITLDQYQIHIRDHGPGIDPEDMPFIFHKFYRGKNAGDAPGSGLGLYIVQYIMTEMKGGIELLNHKDGLEAVVWLPIEENRHS